MAEKTSQTLGQRFLGVLGLTTQTAAKQAEDKRATRAYESGYNDGNDDPASGQIAAGGYGYRRISAQAREGGIAWGENLETCWALWQSNPIAKRFTDLKRDYIVGGAHEVQWSAADIDLQEILANFWETNNLDEHIPEFALQLFLFGGQCYPAFVRESDGFVRMAYIDPGEITEVLPHPDNSMEMWAVVAGPTGGARAWENASENRVYRIVRRNEGVGVEHTDRLVTAEQIALQPWESEMLKAFGLAEYTGSCFYYRANYVSNQTTGYGDLLSVADYLDQFDGTLFALGERELFRDFFGFDVTMEDASPDELRERRASLAKNPPARGMANIHNQKEIWDIFAPDLGQPGSVATVQEQKASIIGGLGFPEAWYGAAGGTHLATAQAQGDPTWRSLRYAQGRIQKMIEDFLKFARDQAIIGGAWNPKDIGTDEAKDETISVTMPEMTAKDLMMVSGVLSTVAAALFSGVDAEWITPEEAQEVFKKLLSELGVDLQPAAETEVDDEGSAVDDGADNLRLWDKWDSGFKVRQGVIDGGEAQ